jgi:hypothetical protein
MKRFLILALLALTLASCTDQQMAKDFGGSATVNLPAGEKLVNVTWKGPYDIWYLTRKMTEKDSAETYTFRQEKGSVFDLTGDGQVIIKETKFN